MLYLRLTMSNNLNHIIFKRLISLREEFGFTQRVFVENFNSFMKEKDYEISIKENRYTNIEKRLSTTSDLLLHFINYYQEKHDIDPTWLLSPDNLLCSKYVVYNNDETRELLLLRSTIDSIEASINKIKNPNKV